MSGRHGNLQKYRNSNPIQRFLINRFLRHVYALMEGLDCSTVLDAGCAEGFVGRYLTEKGDGRFTVVGVDIDLAALRRGHDVFPGMRGLSGNVVALPFAEERFDLVLCAEVLEHLLDPVSALHELHRVTAKYCILSVPHEPWFRLMNFLRGRQLKRFGNDPEHLQNWTGRQFSALVSQSFQIIASESVLPWLVVLGEKKR